MTRRILLVLLTFTAAVLVGAVVPLTLDAASHDRTSFIQATAGLARTDAAIAQSRLDALASSPSGSSADAGGGKADPALLVLIDQTKQIGDGLLILSGPPQDDHRLVDNGMPPGNWVRLAIRASEQGQLAKNAGRPVEPVTEAAGSQLAAAMPVFRGGRYGLVGTVILTRSTSSLDGDIVKLWVILGTIAVLAMIGATLLAFGLARWVSRPLAGLDTAAGRLADGDLAIRAVVDSGPPELRRLATTFNTMAGRLEALVHGNRAVIADVSHQLRTPLAALRLRLDLLAADPDPDPETTGTSWPARSKSWPGCPAWWTACSRWRARGTWYRCPPRWTWPRWPGSGSWRGTRWPTTAASCSRPAKGPGPRGTEGVSPLCAEKPGGGRARRCWPGWAKATWSRCSTTSSPTRSTR